MPISITTQHNNNFRTGANLEETRLRPDKVKVAKFGRLFDMPVDGHIYGQPLYLPGVNIPGLGVRNVVYVATMHNSVYAFDAENSPGSRPLWHKSLGLLCNSRTIRLAAGLNTTTFRMRLAL